MKYSGGLGLKLRVQEKLFLVILISAIHKTIKTNIAMLSVMLPENLFRQPLHVSSSKYIDAR